MVSKDKIKSYQKKIECLEDTILHMQMCIDKKDKYIKTLEKGLKPMEFTIVPEKLNNSNKWKVMEWEFKEPLEKVIKDRKKFIRKMKNWAI